jgi:hypothetical protein
MLPMSKIIEKAFEAKSFHKFKTRFQGMLVVMGFLGFRRRKAEVNYEKSAA